MTPATGAPAEQQIEYVALVEELDAGPQALLVKGLQQVMAGQLAGDRRAPQGARATLTDPSLGGPAEGQAEALELAHRFRRRAAHLRRSFLVDEVVARSDGVGGVLLPAVGVRLGAGERRVDSRLGGAGERAGRMQLAHHRRASAAARLESGPQAGGARADDHDVVRVVVAVQLHQCGSLSIVSC